MRKSYDIPKHDYYIVRYRVFNFLRRIQNIRNKDDTYFDIHKRYLLYLLQKKMEQAT